MLFEVNDLRIQINTQQGISTPVDGVSFSVDAGETLGIVGESGSGKSLSSLAILRLLPPAAQVTSGQILLDGEDLLKLTNNEIHQVRGREISMILQDPMMSLNPAYTLGDQVAEAITLHEPLRGKPLIARIVELLRLVRIPSAESRIHNYPHQFSGGMRQRAVGAIALTSPGLKLLIADEPTTALDATVQAQYLDLLMDLQKRVGFGLIFITHDIGAVAEICDRVAVMYAGRVVESGPADDVIRRPAHPYTRALLNCFPRLSEVRRLEVIAGETPNPLALPQGCRFSPRCQFATDLCRESYPDVVQVAKNHTAACWYIDER